MPEIKRTYFMNRLTGDELAALLAGRKSFVLENVTGADRVAADCQAALSGQGLVCRIDDYRMSPGRETAVMLLPWWLSLPVIGREGLRQLANRRRHRNPHLVIVMKSQSLDFRWRRQA